jgi:squalene-associated FAD-dependent desaturase
MTVTVGRPAVAVVGGGLAGMTTAIRLTDAGCAVSLLESKPKLGGLTHSVRRGALDVDNGQHVFMRCCTAYRALLDRLGVTGDTFLQSRLDVPVRSVDGISARLARNGWRPPLHLGPALLRYSVLAPADRMRAVRGALAMRGVDRHDPRTDDTLFADWLVRHGQNAATIEALWDLVGVATTNAAATDVSLAIAAMVFQVGLLTDADAADIGWSRVPLQHLHGDAAQGVLRAGGADVRLRTKVDRLEQTKTGWLVVADDVGLDVDAVVIATDPVHAERLMPAGAAAPVGWSRALGSSPIVNVHLVFDRQVMTEPFLAGVGTDVQWVFDRTLQSGLRSGQYVALSLSAADKLLSLPVAGLRARFVPEVAKLLPAARSAELVDFFVTREPHATFRPAPGSARLRPAAVTQAPGLYRAGAYTATGWPATM